MSYRLDTPYTFEDKQNFLYKHGEMYQRRIVELDTLYALEPYETLENGKIVINENYNNEILESHKLFKINENNVKRNIRLSGGVTYNDVLFDSDTDQKVNLLATVNMMSDTDTVVWFGMDNQGLLCTKADLMAIGGLITELHSFCWQNNAYIKEQIENAESIEEVENIVIDYDRKE